MNASSASATRVFIIVNTGSHENNGNFSTAQQTQKGITSQPLVTFDVGRQRSACQFRIFC